MNNKCKFCKRRKMETGQLCWYCFMKLCEIQNEMTLKSLKNAGVLE